MVCGAATEKEIRKIGILKHTKLQNFSCDDGDNKNDHYHLLLSTYYVTRITLGTLYEWICHNNAV